MLNFVWLIIVFVVPPLSLDSCKGGLRKASDFWLAQTWVEVAKKLAYDITVPEISVSWLTNRCSVVPKMEH